MPDNPEIWKAVAMADHFEKIQKLPDPIPGVPNFRRVPGYKVYCCGQPTQASMETIQRYGRLWPWRTTSKKYRNCRIPFLECQTSAEFLDTRCTAVVSLPKQVWRLFSPRFAVISTPRMERLSGSTCVKNQVSTSTGSQCALGHQTRLENTPS